LNPQVRLMGISGFVHGDRFSKLGEKYRACVIFYGTP
jgi:hypothetical protein